MHLSENRHGGGQTLLFGQRLAGLCHPTLSANLEHVQHVPADLRADTGPILVQQIFVTVLVGAGG